MPCHFGENGMPYTVPPKDGSIKINSMPYLVDRSHRSFSRFDIYSLDKSVPQDEEGIKAAAARGR